MPFSTPQRSARLLSSTSSMIMGTLCFLKVRPSGLSVKEIVAASLFSSVDCQKLSSRDPDKEDGSTAQFPINPPNNRHGLDAKTTAIMR
eukprot:CAMPEP_0172856706 /NCGR_PEP_ID=MMETSP1075-20121228/64193_1 /TAXON_ID=2916 /ORGANISM="Ceratium fusus, Strain PA161109" /LENGTH=88 /DNA_ID=CAMNT_0013703925 /DNA_START=365 /DNA_END=631 /DNA_ORIENTATION=-